MCGLERENLTVIYAGRAVAKASSSAIPAILIIVFFRKNLKSRSMKV
jgi:hypothetical protein